MTSAPALGSMCKCHQSELHIDDINQEWLLMWGAKDLRDAGHLVDVTLIAEGKKLKPCHRVVLAASSPYFRAMFSNNMMEQNLDEVKLQNVEFSSINAIVDYLYTSKIVINDDNVQSIFTCCSMLQVLGLHGKCKRYIMSRLSLYNCIDVYCFAKSLGSIELQIESFRFVASRFCDFVKTKDFVELDKESLVDIISSDDLLVEKEETVYEAALRWLSHDIQNRSFMISEILSYIRMPLLCHDYMNECIVKEDALMNEPQLKEQVHATAMYKSIKTMWDQNEKKKLSTTREDVKSNSLTQSTTDSTVTTVTAEDKSSVKNTEKVLSDDELRFLECPFYKIRPRNCTSEVRIPLATRLRSGMKTETVLLFSNGKRTFLFDPIKHKYYHGDSSTSDATGPKSRSDRLMPVMKNAEIFATRNGTVYLLGGLEIDKEGSSSALKCKMFVFDLKRLQWSQRASYKSPRCMMGMAELAGTLFVTGGKELSIGCGVSTVSKYNYDDDAWTDFTPMPLKLYGHGCASLIDRIYIFGGKTTERKLSTDVYFLVNESNAWCRAPSLLVPRFLAGCTTFISEHGGKQTETIYIVGGVGDVGLLKSIECYSPSCDEGWNMFGDFPGGRCAQTVTIVGGKICVVGGHATERNEDGRFVSRPKFDVTQYDETSQFPKGSSENWKTIVSFIRGLQDGLFACAALKVDTTRIGK
ncbi:kelch-like protein 40 [Ciona intestinalis]